MEALRRLLLVATLLLATLAADGSSRSVWPVVCGDLPSLNGGSLRETLFSVQPINTTDELKCISCETSLCSCLDANKGASVENPQKYNTSDIIAPQLAYCPKLNTLLNSKCVLPAVRKATDSCVSSYMTCKQDLARTLIKTIPPTDTSWCARWAHSLSLAEIANEAYIEDLYLDNAQSLPHTVEVFNTTLGESCLHTSCLLFDALSMNPESGCGEAEYNVTDVCWYRGPLPTPEPTTAPPPPETVAPPTAAVKLTVNLTVALSFGTVPGLSTAELVTQLYLPRLRSMLLRLLASSLEQSNTFQTFSPEATPEEILNAINSTNVGNATVYDVFLTLENVDETGRKCLIGVALNTTSSAATATLSGWSQSAISRPEVLQELGVLGGESSVDSPDAAPIEVTLLASEEKSLGVPIWAFFVTVVLSCVLGIGVGFIVAKYVINTPEVQPLRQRILQEPILEGADDD